MNRPEMVAMVRSLIEDPDGDFVTGAELDLHFDDVALDFTRRSKILRGVKSLNYSGGSSYVNLPDDMYELIRVEGPDRSDICRTTSRYLGEFFANQGGTPREYTRDLTGPTQILLYPTPQEDGQLVVHYYKQHVPGYSIDVPAVWHPALCWGIAAKALSKSTNPADDPSVQKFTTLYEAKVNEAFVDGTKDFSSDDRYVWTSNY